MCKLVRCHSDLHLSTYACLGVINILTNEGEIVNILIPWSVSNFAKVVCTSV